MKRIVLTAVAAIFFAVPAGANPITITGEDNFGNTATNTAGSPVNFGPTSVGTWTAQGTASGTPPLPQGALFSNSITVNSDGPGSFTLWVTETGLTGSIGAAVDFLSSLTTNLLFGGITSVVATTSIQLDNSTPGPGVPLGTILDATTFLASNQTQTQITPAFLSGTYSLTEQYIVNATGIGGANLTIDLVEQVPEPGSLLLFGTFGVASLFGGFVARRPARLTGNAVRDPITILVLGEPLGFARTRPNRVTGQLFTPRPQRNAAVVLRFQAANVMRDSGAAPFDEPIRLDLTAEFSIPASWSKKKQAAALAGLLRPTRKPDLSNVVKLAEDALNGICYRDDVQICTLSARKVFSAQPKLVITVRPLDSALPLRSDALANVKRRAVDARRLKEGADGAAPSAPASDYGAEDASCKVKRRPHTGRRFVGGCDGQTSQTLASHYPDSDRQNQGGALSEDGQPVCGRVGLPRSRRP